ncbi:MFS transporter, partial [Streptomyces alkaliphilus]|uniref:MFS transporter n=1 Tax=Streptomyces alkaliphilus TaxID=1472722 RepID=UPI00225E1E37
MIGAAPGPGLLLAAVALGGLPQALANPATNKAILAAVPKPGRGAVTGLKQSGVQAGAFVAGLPLAALAAVAGWRVAVWAVAGAAVIAALWATRLLPADPRVASVPALRAPRGAIAVLAVFSVFPGCAIASVNTYIALFGTQRLDLGATTAAALVAVLGVTGIAGRVVWSRVAADPVRAVWLPGLLSVGSVGAAVLLAVSPAAAPLVWPAAAAVGLLAVAANAVSMVLVIQRSGAG